MKPAEIMTVVRSTIGRRNTIDRNDMVALLVALARAGFELRHPSGYDDEAHTRPAVEADAWAIMCKGICCVSIIAGRECDQPKAWLRYDEPGSMHPLQHAVLTFVAAENRGDECDTIGYLRRHADRVLLVRAEGGAK